MADGMALRDAETNCSAFHGVYTWTYEEEDKIKWYLNQGVNGIIVNTNACYQFVNPWGPEVIDSAEEVVAWAKAVPGRKFATRADNPFDMRPQIACPSNVTVECAAPGGTPATDQTLLGFHSGATCSSGYCGSVNLTNNAPSLYPIGTTDVTFTATTAQVGSCTPTQSCTASVTVQDTLPQHGLLLELFAIRLDDGLDRLPRRRRIGMDQEQDLRLLVIDAAGRCPPLALRLPHGQALGESQRDLVAQKHLPLELADGALRACAPEGERCAELGGGRGAAVHGDCGHLGADRRHRAPATQPAAKINVPTAAISSRIEGSPGMNVRAF